VEIKKAIITAAGATQRTLPLQTLVDRDGQTKTALRILIEEILSGGIEEICVVVCPGDQSAYTAAAGGFGARLRFVEQREALGYGHAVLCAREFTEGKPFLLLVGDHLYVNGDQKRSASNWSKRPPRRIVRSRPCRPPTKASCPTMEPWADAWSPAAGAFTRSPKCSRNQPDRGRATAYRARVKGGTLPLLFRDACANARLDGVVAEEAGQTGTRGVSLTRALAQLARQERYLAFEVQATATTSG